MNVMQLTKVNKGTLAVKYYDIFLNYVTASDVQTDKENELGSSSPFKLYVHKV